MRKKINIIVGVILLGFTSFINVQADERYNEFSVTPIYNENQRESSRSVGYYDLRLDESQKDTIYLNISNEGQEVMDAKLNITNAITSENGLANYHTANKPSDSIPLTMTEIASLELDSYTINPGESIDVPITLEMPTETFDGVVLGGVSVVANSQSNSKTEENGVVSAVKYLVAIQVSMNDNEVEEVIKNVDKGVKVENNKPDFFATIINENAVNIKPVSISGKLFDKDQESIIGSVSTETGNILPQSEFDVVFDLIKPNQKIENGEYHYILDIKSDDNSWQFEDTILVDAELKTEINEKIVSDEKSNNVILWILASIVIILSVAVIYMYHKLNEKNK